MLNSSNFWTMSVRRVGCMNARISKSDKPVWNRKPCRVKSKSFWKAKEIIVIFTSWLWGHFDIGLLRRKDAEGLSRKKNHSGAPGWWKMASTNRVVWKNAPQNCMTLSWDFSPTWDNLELKNSFTKCPKSNPNLIRFIHRNIDQKRRKSCCRRSISLEFLRKQMYNCFISLKTEIEDKPWSWNLKGSTYANMQSSKVWVFPLTTPCKTLFHTSLGIKKMWWTHVSQARSRPTLKNENDPTILCM